MSRIARPATLRTADTSLSVLAGAVALVEGPLDPVCRDGQVIHQGDGQPILARVGGEVVRTTISDETARVRRFRGAGSQ
jgi:hypothetical protein